MKTRAIIHEQYGKELYLDEIILPDPGPNEVVLKLYASGICGSQLYNLSNKNLSSPELLGHEGTGVVLKAGCNVKHVKEGARAL